MKYIETARPLYNIEFEQLLIVSCISTETIGVRDLIVSNLKPEHFHSSILSELFAGIQNLYNKGVVFDTMILLDYFNHKEEMVAYIEQIVEDTAGDIINDESIIHYINRIKDLYILRKTDLIITESKAKLNEPLMTSKEILSKLETDVYELQRSSDIKDFDTVNLDESIDNILNGEEIKSVESGYVNFDEMLGGLRNGNFIIIAGRPSHGKSAFVLNILRAVSENKKAVGLFSIEMSKFENECRFVAMQAKVDLLNIIQKRLNDNERKLILDSKGTNTTSIYINDRCTTLRELRYQGKKMVKDKAVELIVVDYIQLLTDEQKAKDNRNIELSHISRSLKQLAKELNVPIIGVSQLNRDMEKRGKSEREPKLSDLRDSGALEQDADVVVFVFRADMYEDPMEADIIIAKARNAKVGKVPMEFHPDYQLFFEK